MSKRKKTEYTDLVESSKAHRTEFFALFNMRQKMAQHAACTTEAEAAEYIRFLEGQLWGEYQKRKAACEATGLSVQAFAEATSLSSCGSKV